ncbi:MAG: hypothetical protein AB8F95_12875 [Bacteroidia bacterium]
MMQPLSFYTPLIIILFSFFACGTIKVSTQKNEIREAPFAIKIKSCKSATAYLYEHGKITLYYFRDTSEYQISKADSIQFERLGKACFADGEHEILTTLSSDGFSYKIHVEKDSSLKKIFISNAYDLRVDQLCILFNKYFSTKYREYFSLNNIGYRQIPGFDDFDDDIYFELPPPSDTMFVDSFPAAHRAFLLDTYCP